MSSTALDEPEASAVQFERSLGRLVLGQYGPAAPWEEPTLKALLRLMLLPPDWDSYGARPIEPQCVWAAWHLVAGLLRPDSPAPAVVPTARGGVQLEWHRDGVDLEIEVAAPHQLVVSLEIAATGESWEKTVTVDSVELIAAVDRITTGGSGNGRSDPG